ncbi:hypothetical protein GCM10010307_64080 [Streptomyces vastus]|uniref:Uncharacterized protein n=1 Tax=Streptomyces vastus TaxID=285451 RepID=A0ABN3RHY7_9ACTN
MLAPETCTVFSVTVGRSAACAWVTPANMMAAPATVAALAVKRRIVISPE